MSQLKLESTLSKIEYYLTFAAVIPILGAVPACIKAGLGTVQATSALALCLFSAVPALAGNRTAKDLFHYSWAHVQYGGENICTGVFEAIPGIALCLLLHFTKPKDGLHFFDDQFRFLPYHTISINEGRLTWGKCYFLNAIDELFEGMRYKEALELGLINEKFEIVEEAYERTRDKYLMGEIPLRQKYIQERKAEAEKTAALRPRILGFRERNKILDEDL
jgi:hypothetical protein